MDYNTFLDTVTRRAPVPPEKVEPLTRATLETLAERLTRGEAKDLASELPKPLKEWLVSPTPEARRFGFDEFVNRVSSQAGVSPHQAREGIRAELNTLRDAVSEGEFRQVMSQLPGEFEALVGVPG
ncbi:uncharacterized protein (DUF2267 family) [Streptomyces sp. BK022]|uniref:DUF2267 domain-containing protein n=1 Tax=Streptomyces sp. BK022 TaxID=2512123 RepID=UPI001029BC41|nr:DUF2267 domain-containing protein [Streptomyces sp. BK022]RZU45688.1 uncharacterized protein (DUF2267 family) [Streptomyces sp. BK022]